MTEKLFCCTSFTVFCRNVCCCCCCFCQFRLCCHCCWSCCCSSICNNFRICVFMYFFCRRSCFDFHFSQIPGFLFVLFLWYSAQDIDWCSFSVLLTEQTLKQQERKRLLHKTNSTVSWNQIKIYLNKGQADTNFNSASYFNTRFTTVWYSSEPYKTKK